MKRFTLVWTAKARHQLLSIRSYIEIESPSASRNIVKQIRSRVEQLQDFPEIGTVDSFLIDFKKGYRFLISGNYKIVYRKEGSAILINAIFDTRRDPTRLIEELGE